MARERDIPTPLSAPKEMPHYEGAFIAINNINVLNQPRQTFLDIDLIAQDIARKNLLNPLTVAELDRAQAQEYIDTINEIWGTNHTIDELKQAEGENIEEKYYILIAGERRLKALKQLDTVGCFDCQEAFGKGPCSTRHPHVFKDGNKIEARLMRNFDALTAIDTQASENTHLRPAPQEEALFYDRYYKLKKRINSKYTIAQFSRDVGKSPDTITSALRFCKLPDEIQEFVANGTISYGIGVELQRAREALGLDGLDLKYWLLKAITERFSVAEFSKAVSAEIEMKNSNQTMLGIFDQTQEEEMKKAHRKKIVERNTINMLWGYLSYFNKVLSLFEDGSLGKKDSPFSVRSPLRVYRAVITQEKRLLPHLKGLLTQEEFEETVNVLEASENLISALELTESEETQVFPTLAN